MSGVDSEEARGILGGRSTLGVTDDHFAVELNGITLKFGPVTVFTPRCLLPAPTSTVWPSMPEWEIVGRWRSAQRRILDSAPSWRIA